MSEPPTAHYKHYQTFLDEDPRRQADALEFGHDWHDNAGDRYRVCWYAQTGELTAERLSQTQPLQLEDFHAGITGPVEIIARIPTRSQLDKLIGPWPQATPGQPHTLSRLRQLAQHKRHLRAINSD